jgi:small subunit ribosomal protein S11
MAYIKKNKKNKIAGEVAVVCVNSTFNNTLVTVTTPSGDVLLRSSAGRLKYKGARKGTPFVASQVSQSLVKDMEGLGIKAIEINIRGIGYGRDSVVRAMQSAGFQINFLRDVTPVPFAGCRPRKRRRT